jgi:hypothetical protein
LQRSGAADAARADAEQLCQKALEALESRAIPAGIGPRLRAIALYAIQRAL